MDMRNRGVAVAIVAGVLAMGVGLGSAARARADEASAKPDVDAKPDVEMTVAAILYEGTKLWVPATIAVHKGDRVKVNLINKIPSGAAQHGWAIDAFKVAKVVNRGEPVAAEFVADQAGVFPIYCQLHPAHVGGQLIVLDGD